MARRTLLLIASILTAALGTALIWLYVQGAENRVANDTKPVSVLVFTGEAPAGTAANNLPVVLTPVPETLARGAVASLNDVRTLQLTDRAVAGQLLLKGMLGTTTSSGLAPGRGAFSLSISDPDRVPAQLHVGHTVSIYAVKGTGKGRIVVDKIPVLSIGSATQTSAASGGAAGAAPVPVTIVGFDADPKQAAAMVAMLSAGEQPVLYDMAEGTKALPPAP